MKKTLRHFRFLFRLTLVFLHRHLLPIGLSVALGVLVFAFGSPVYQRYFGKKQVRIGIVGRHSPDELPKSISQLITLGLTQLAEDKTVLPSVAKFWEVNQDSKAYKFYLRDDLLWQDGSHFTAKDINLDLKSAQWQTISDFQIKITLEEPFSPLPSLLTRPLFKENFIGLGSYKVSQLKKSGPFLTMVKLTPLEKDSGPEYFYRFYTTQEAARTGFKLGEVDQLQDLTELGDLEHWPGTKTTFHLNKDRYLAIILNVKSEKFKEKSVRQSLAYAIKKEEGKKRAFGPINPESWAYNPKLKPYNYDLSHAEELLGEAEITPVELSTFSSLIAQAETIKEAWENLGIQTTVRIVNQLPDRFEALLAVWEIPADPDQYSSWHSIQKSNLSGLANPKIDKALEEGRKATDLALRKKAYWEFQKTLLEESPAIFLSHPLTYTIVRN